jgi:hypothetical protein
LPCERGLLHGPSGIVRRRLGGVDACCASAACSGWWRRRHRDQASTKPGWMGPVQTRSTSSLCPVVQPAALGAVASTVDPHWSADTQAATWLAGADPWVALISGSLPLMPLPERPGWSTCGFAPASIAWYGRDAGTSNGIARKKSIL